jgi:hypothetical protein
MDSVFMSLIQDFVKKCLNEPWVAVGTVLKARSAQPPLELPPETQFIVVLKGIGANVSRTTSKSLTTRRQTCSETARGGI